MVNERTCFCWQFVIASSRVLVSASGLATNNLQAQVVQVQNWQNLSSKCLHPAWAAWGRTSSWRFCTNSTATLQAQSRWWGYFEAPDSSVMYQKKDSVRKKRCHHRVWHLLGSHSQTTRRIQLKEVEINARFPKHQVQSSGYISCEYSEKLDSVNGQVARVPECQKNARLQNQKNILRQRLSYAPNKFYVVASWYQ